MFVFMIPYHPFLALSLLTVRHESEVIWNRKEVEKHVREWAHKHHS
jgi:hypothetical protein